MPASATISRAIFLVATTLAGFVGVQLFARIPHSAEMPRIEYKAGTSAKETKPIEVKAREFPPGFNHALASNGAFAIGGRDAGVLIDGDDQHYTGGTGFGMTQWNAEPPQAFVITLKKAYELDCIKFLLWDRSEERYYRYKLEVSADDKGQSWELVADQTGPTVECKSWQTIRFAPRMVHQIRLTGTYNSANNGFHVVELQASLGVPVDKDAPPSTESLDF